MSSMRASSFVRQARVARPQMTHQRPPSTQTRRRFASQHQQHQQQQQQSRSSGGWGGIPIALGAVALIVPGGLYLLSSGHDNVRHNDHDAQKGLHTAHTVVEGKHSGSGGRFGGRLQGIDQVVTTKHDDVDSDLPHDAPNHPVNREKIDKTMQLKPPTKRTDPMKSVS